MAKAKELKFDQKISRLQEIISTLEDIDISLEDGVNLYKEGVLLSRSCRAQLDSAKIELATLSEENTNK